MGLPDGTPLWWTVGEADAPRVVEVLGEDRKEDVILVQNELFAPIWRTWGLSAPTVAVVWTSVKPGEVPMIGYRSAVFGRHAESVRLAHAGADVPCITLASPEDLNTELVAKYAMILAFNALGLFGSQRVATWLEEHAHRVDDLVHAGVLLGAKLADGPLNQEVAYARGKEGLAGLGGLKAGGRSAASRISRALAAATAHDLELPALREAAAHLSHPR